MGRIYLSPPDVTDIERAALLEAFDSNWITPLGPAVDRFEGDLCEFTGAPAAAALSSGTAALHLALLLAGVGQGDRVVVPTLTFVAPAAAVTYVGAEPVFVDSEPRTWNLDPDLLADVLDNGPRVAAVIAVDLYGQCAELDRIAGICDSHGVPLIEDAAEALGATWMGRPAGTWGRYSALSFNGNKIMTTGGGGSLLGPADDMERARYLASQARLPFLHYEHEEVGFNYRLSNLLAAVGCGQLRRLRDMIERRHRINGLYREALVDLVQEGVVEFMPWDPRGGPNGWLTVVTLGEGTADPMSVCTQLAAHEIEARPAWKPMHLQPVFRGAPVVGGSVAEHLYARGVCLPSGSSMTDDDVGQVVAALRSALGV